MNKTIYAVLRPIFACTVLVSVLPSFLSARAESLSAKEAVKIALDQNRDLQVVKLNVKRAEAQLMQAGLWPNPELEFIRNTDRTFNNEGEYSGAAGLKQRFPISGRLARANAVARVDVAMALAEIRNQERLLVGEVSGSLRELSVIDEKLKVNEKLQLSIQKLIKVSEKRLNVAEVSEADVNLEKLELQKLRLVQVSLQSERESVNEVLNRRLGQAAGTVVNSIDPLSPAALELTTFAQAKAEAVKRRPDRQLAALSIDRAASEVKLARAERWEDWTIGFEYSRDKAVYDSPLVPSSRDDFIGFSVSIPLPLWNQNQGKIAEAYAAQAQSRASLHALELEIETEAEAAYRQLEKLMPHLTRYETESFKLAEKNVHLLKESYSQGLVGISSVIQAQQQLADIRQGYTDLLGEFLKAQTNFETVTASSPFWEKTL